MSLDWKCEVCGASKGEPCVSTLKRKDGTVAPSLGRSEHYARRLPPGQSKAPEKRNEALA